MSASRSVYVQFLNQTSQSLVRQSFGLQGGIWSGNNQQVPPEQIAANSNANWASESNGFMTGTQGYASYAIGGDTSKIITVGWDDPYAGSDSYPASWPPDYTLSTNGGQGNNATVIFTLTTS